MTTARDIITSALRKIAVLGTGSSLSSDEANDALLTLNNLMSSFSAEGAMVFQETKETFPLVNGQFEYTIGIGSDFSTVSPLSISAAYVTQGSTDYTLSAYDEVEYAGIAQKSITGSVPDIYYYDNNFPVANIFFYPAPSGASTFTMYTRKPLTEFTDLDTVFAMPAQYESMLIHNLAEWIAPEYEREASPTIRMLAEKTKKTVEVQNNKNEGHISSLSGIPSGGAGGYNSRRNVLGGYYT